ncbi:hypothetical protein [Faecalibacterium sp. Marseille-P9312]|uniref:hypothetical protein n=1 Tax=Faecalibacterium sp. Marseille-P9312 TaxID=2580425 RepID=UPI00122C893F|nr:hypothetical protein [Faecalibacterium sp. Marseille-P9312]
MKYTKHHFSSGMKINLADVLNRLEDGIAAACGAAVEGIGSVTTGDTPAAGIRDGKLCLTLPRGEPGPQGDPGEGLSDNAKALLLSLLAGTAPDRDASLAALRAEWGVADRSTDTETAAAAPGAAGADTEAASAERGA